MPEAADPSRILSVATSFWNAKALLSAVELGIFSALGDGAMTGDELGKAVGMHARGVKDFPDTLVAMGFLGRDGEGPGARYRNTPDTGALLVRGEPGYIGGFLEMLNDRLYGFWGDLTEALRTGKPQTEVKHSGKSVFESLYADPARLEQFMSAMAGISAGNFRSFVDKFDFEPYRTLCDVGGATGQLCIFAARADPQLRCISFDLPAVEPIAQRTIEAAGVADRVKAVSGDFFAGGIPQSDVITMAQVLHDWNLDDKMRLIQAAYDALTPGGAFVAIEHLIDDARRQNVFGLLLSLNMLIEIGDAFDYTFADFDGWCRKVGFKRTEVIPLGGPAAAAVAYK